MQTDIKNRRIPALLSVLLAATVLASCGASHKQLAATDQAATSSAADFDAAPAAGAESYENGAGGSAITLPEDSRKISLTAHLTLEALDFDATCKQLQKNAETMGGYISASDFYGGSGPRSATLTIKIPSDKYSSFLDSASQAGNVISRSETSEDLTEQYVDVEARLKSLRAQEERLLEMMAEAQELSDLILIQDQLSNVQYEIESYVTQQRYLDGRIDYSTVYANVQEVEQITEAQDSYWSRIATAFRDGWREAGLGLQQLSIWLVRMLPLILLAAIILAIALVVNRRIRKKRVENPPVKSRTVHPPAGVPYAVPPYPGAPYSPYPPYPVPRMDSAHSHNSEEGAEKLSPESPQNDPPAKED